MVIGAAIVVVAGTFPMGAAAGSLPRSLDRTPSGDRVSGLTLSQAPSGLRAAVGRTLGVRDTAVSSPFQQAKLTVACGCTNGFGGSVAIYGATAVVGSPSSGAAYVFVRSGTKWSKQAKLTAPHGGAGFGSPVAIYRSTAVIGGGTSSAYVFVRSGTKWSRQATLRVRCGCISGVVSSVAIYGATAVLGADEIATAYVFVRSGTKWSRQATLTAAHGYFFGDSVAIYRSTAVIGDDHIGTRKGAAFVFVRSGTKWSQQAELTNRHVSGAANFGDSVAIYGQTAVIGAQGKNSYTGAAYVYVRSGSKWSRQAKLTASDAAVGDQFGTAVAINGSTAVIGARDASSTGAAYVFVRSRSRWSQQAKLTASDAAADDEFGYSVGIYGATAVVGAPFKESGGAAYVFAGL